MRVRKSMKWEVKLFGSIFIGLFLIIGLSFAALYFFFVNKITNENEHAVTEIFRNADTELKYTLTAADRAMGLLSDNKEILKYLSKESEDALANELTKREIIKSFDNLLISNADISGIAIVCGDGRVVLSTTRRNSQSTTVHLSDSLAGSLYKSQSAYPHTVWLSSSTLTIPENSPLYLLKMNPVLIGIKSLDEATSIDKEGFLFVAINEPLIQEKYKQVQYNGSRAALVDANNNIISATDDSLLGKRYEANHKFHTISHKLTFQNWRLINMFPKGKYYSEAHQIMYFGLISEILVLIGMIAFLYLWSQKYTKPIQVLMEQMRAVSNENFDIELPKAKGWSELNALNTKFYTTVQKLKQYIDKVHTAEQALAKEELLALQYQINPHFLYNSLNSIRWLALMTNNTKVADALVTLSKIIMPIYRSTDNTWLLEDELAFIKNYTEMMKIRYGNNVLFDVQSPKSLEKLQFPKFILQPVIENCFVHGIKKEAVNHITMTIVETDKNLIFVTIQNDGTPLPYEKVSQINRDIKVKKARSEKIGLANVQRRLELLYGKDGNIWLEYTTNDNITVCITLGKLTKNSNICQVASPQRTKQQLSSIGAKDISFIISDDGIRIKP